MILNCVLCCMKAVLSRTAAARGDLLLGLSPARSSPRMPRPYRVPGSSRLGRAALPAGSHPGQPRVSPHTRAELSAYPEMGWEEDWLGRLDCVLE